MIDPFGDDLHDFPIFSICKQGLVTTLNPLLKWGKSSSCDVNSPLDLEDIQRLIEKEVEDQLINAAAAEGSGSEGLRGTEGFIGPGVTSGSAGGAGRGDSKRDKNLKTQDSKTMKRGRPGCEEEDDAEEDD